MSSNNEAKECVPIDYQIRELNAIVLKIERVYEDLERFRKIFNDKDVIDFSKVWPESQLNTLGRTLNRLLNQLSSIQDTGNRVKNELDCNSYYRDGEDNRCICVRCIMKKE